MTRWYGSVQNRIEEGRQLVPQIEVGTDITMYLWSDRTCYYVTEVTDQKHIKVRPYRVIADRSKTGGMGHQNWLYFKTNADADAYLKQYFPDHVDCGFEQPEESWAFRYGNWYHEWVYTAEDLPNVKDWMTEKEVQKLMNGKTVTKYSALSGRVSIGVRNYHYDWEF